MQKTEHLSFLSEILSVPEHGSLAVTGTEKNARLLSAVWAFENSASAVLLVCRNDFEARNISEELCRYLPAGSVLTYPCESFYFSLPDSYSTLISVERLRAVEALRGGGKKLIVTSAFALCETYPVSSSFGGSYSVGDRLERDDLIEALSSMGYCREDRVFSRGQFSVRGGIVDFFSPSDELPVRVEFWDDEIDSVRRFSPEDQLTVKNDDGFSLTSFDQYAVSPEKLREGLAAFREEREKALGRMEDGELRELAEQESAELTERIEADLPAASRLLFPFCDVPRRGILSEGKDYLIMFSDIAVMEEGVKEALKRASDDIALLSERALAFPRQMEIFTSLNDVLRSAREDHPSVFFCASDEKKYSFADRMEYMGGADVINYRGNLRLFLPALDFYRRNDYSVIICCASSSETQSCGRLLDSYGIGYSSVPSASSVAVIETGEMPGVDFPARKLVLVPYRFLMPSESSSARKTEKRTVEEFFSDIKPGDYVVHDTHGIGVFEGMVRLETDGVSRDYIKIAYAGSDILFMPPEQMDLIQKYVGAGDAPPKVNKLGGAEWSNARRKVSKAVKELAQEYIKMYASRQSIRGYSFCDDTVYQAEFEDSFEYIPTEDQRVCSEEIKRDMEKPVPMDRLLMGDVGFGKTEVAMRAAFKAVMEPKQVAVLVPTTILALQHYNNFIERFKGYPVNIELMCRFRTPSQIKKTAERVRTGEVDILIGTHRILSSDVKFRDLGLLIIDEEQRFGVAHKDKLKLMKTNVDTLTLSATPIPRTMHMSLSGIRDMSVINTPPVDRLEVQTFVMPSDETVIKSAILNEVSRGGQVFYLYNKVETISERAWRLSEMLPGVRVCCAHGQMEERELEKRVLDFLDGRYDVMVCTTIIENGV
ncbi:MAG: DEAD/DEAH box helicase, partial [Eubacteriaceae bacterium]|nr:DEAD/DEAH box helicase [Eubacteriaceae bacterium]